MTGIETGVLLAYAAAASAAVAAAGTAYAGIQQSKAAEFQEELARRDAELARQTGLANAEEARRRGQRLIAAQRAAAGASGLVVEEGSPLELVTQTARDAEMDALRVRFGSDVSRLRAEGRAEARSFEGEAALTSGAIGAGTRLLRGGERVLEVT